MPPVFRRAHARMVTEEMAKVKLAGEIQLRRHIFHRQPPISEQQSRLIQTCLLDVSVNGSLA